jgi:hypothetical protein
VQDGSGKASPAGRGQLENARAAFEDPSLRTNPRMPLVAELQALLEAAWSGDVRAPG